MGNDETEKKGIVEKLGITPGPWDRSELQVEKYLISKDDCSLLSVANEYDPCRETYKPWGIFGKSEDAQICAAAPEMLKALIDLTVGAINDKYNELHPRYSRNRTDEWIERHVIDYFQSEINTIQKATGKTWEEIKDLL